MEKISDTFTSVFHIATKDKYPLVCSSGSGATVWSGPFGLGWRFGISCKPACFAKVYLYLDHNQSHTEQDQALVSVCLRQSADKDAPSFKERLTTIADFGHGQPVLLGSWTPGDIVAYPYVSLTLAAKARLPPLANDPLPSTALALRQSMTSGDFVDTKYYVFSAKRPRATAGKPRIVYANNLSTGLALPKSTSKPGLTPPFLVNMTGDDHINGESVLHEYEYEQDSDLDDDEAGSDEITSQLGLVSTQMHVPCTGSTQKHANPNLEDELPAEPPAYSVSNCRMILVKDVAYRTWLSYIHFRYTGQMSFLPLKSTQVSSARPPNDSSKPPRCSPKSMYRLAVRLGDERMKELAFRALKEGLSEDNIAKEAFSWFTAQYPAVSEYEVDRLFEFRKSPKVASALKLQLKVVSLGEKPWAQDVLIAIMDKLNPTESST